MKKTLCLISLTLVCSLAHARKDCTLLKNEIEAKIKANGVASFTIEIIDSNQVIDQKVVGSCDGGTKKITYKRN